MFLIDTNVLVYRSLDSPYREPCAALIRAVGEGRAEGRISTSILEEVWHLELRGRLPELEGMTLAYFDVFSPLLPVTDDVFERALRLEAPRLGSNDRIHAATCLEGEIASIVSADGGFDGIRGLRRVDPLDARAMGRLR